jgi:Lipase (class 3)
MVRDKTKIFIMRGLMGFAFPKAMYSLHKMLIADKWNSTMTSWQLPFTKKIEMEAVEYFYKGYDIVICGHSMGGNSGTALSRILAKNNVTVSYLAIIDAPMPVHVGATTEVCDNFFQFKKTMFDPRDPLLKCDSPATKLTQYNFRNKNDGAGDFYVQPESHIGLGSNSFVLRRIMDQIKTL